MSKIEDLQLFATAIEMSIDGIIIGDIQGNITYVNGALLKMYGSNDKNDLVGKHVLDFVAVPHRERAIENSINSIKTGEGWTGKFTVVNKAGFAFPVEITATPIKNSQEVPVGFVDVVRDMSERVKDEEELKEANRKLEVANEKLLVVGGLVRHDIANKLTALNASAYLAQKSGNIKDVLQAAGNVSAEIRRTLDFSRDYEMLGQQELSYINVGNTFNQVIERFPNLKTMQIVNDCSKLEVLSDSLLTELLYNLVENTKKYGEKTKKISLTYILGSKELKLIYEDDGVGIPLDMKTNLFRKNFGKGTGLGLYLIKKTLEVYGWQIKETGAQGQGAKFEITIPQIKQDRTNYKFTD